MTLMTAACHDMAATPSFKTAWWTPRLAGPIIAASVVRLAVSAILVAQNGTSIFLHADTFSYLIPGRNLLLHGQYMADSVPDLLRTPGYPLFLAMTSLAGLPAAAVVNMILSVFSVLLVWRLGRAVFMDGRIALGAAWLYAFEPSAVTSSFVLTSETLFLALFLLSMERLAEFLRGRNLRVLAVAGLWLAAATFVRPVTYYLPVFLALGLLIVLARVPSFPPQRQRPVAGGPGMRWKAPSVLLISVLPWLAAWQMRNWVETSYSGFTSILDENLYYLAAANLTARLEHRPARDVIYGLEYGDYTGNSGQSYLFQPYLAQHPEQVGWSQAQRLAFMHSQSVRLIQAHPAVYLSLCVKDMFTTVFNPVVYYLDRSLHPKPPLHPTGVAAGGPSGWRLLLSKAQGDPFLAAETVISEVVLLAVYLFAARGLLLAVRGTFGRGLHKEFLWLLLGTSLYFLAVSVAVVMGPLATPRYRMPVTPVVCILAVAGFRRTRKDNAAILTGIESGAARL
jgi:Dolichyl-phosphate-mannose-protein mannosyltransferase